MTSSPYADASFPRRSLHHKREYEAFIDRVHASGSPVAEDEICRIENTVLPGINEDVASINGSIASLQSILDSMKAERAVMKNLETIYKAFVPPHRAIPHDIWHEIFSHALALEPCSSVQPSGPIWRLSKVCQNWRTVALSYYSAWCTIEYFTDSADPYLEDKEILDLILQRSHQRPLNITLVDCYYESNLLVPKVLDTLFAESHRWQSLDVSECDPPLYFQWGRLPQLESLTVSYLDRTTGILDVFDDCPRLTQVSLWGAHSYMHLPVAQLTELYLDEHGSSWTPDDVGAYWRLIEECQALRILHISCSLDDRDTEEDVFTPLSMITHPNICKVDIDCMGLLDKLTLPQLHEAALARNSSCRGAMYSLHDFELLLHRSNCARTLTSLKLVGMSLMSRASDGSLRSHLLRDVLSQTVNLRTLDVCLELLTDTRQSDVSAIAQITEVVEALNNTAFLPHLSSLTFDLRGYMSKTITLIGRTGDFVSMVKARWDGDSSLKGSKLEKLHFHVTSETLWKDPTSARKPPRKIHHGFSHAEINSLRALVKKRMNISIRFSDREIL